MTKKYACISNDMQLQKHSLTIIHNNKSLPSATNNLSRSTMAYNTTASLDKLTCTDYVDFGNCQDRFAHFFWSKNASNYLDVKLKFSRKMITTSSDWSKSYNGRGRLTPVPIPTIWKGKDEQLKLAHKVIDVVNRANRKICVTLLQNNVDKPEISYAQVRIIVRKKQDEKFQQVVYVKYKLEDFICLPDVMNSVYNKVITNKPLCNVLYIKKFLCLLFIIMFLFELRWVETLEKTETSFWS